MRLRISVVLPEPRKPVMMVMGIGGAGDAMAGGRVCLSFELDLAMGNDDARARNDGTANKNDEGSEGEAVESNSSNNGGGGQRVAIFFSRWPNSAIDNLKTLPVSGAGAVLLSYQWLCRSHGSATMMRPAGFDVMPSAWRGGCVRREVQVMK